MEPVNNRDFPKMPEPGGRAHALEASASMCWTLLFLAYSSSRFVGEFGHGWSAAWTILLVILPVSLTGTPAIMDGKRGAVPMLASYILYALIPSLLQLSKPKDYNSLHSELADLFTVLLIWLPLEFKLLSTDLSPTGKVTVWGLLTAALTIVNCFTVLRPFSKLAHARELGYSFKVSPVEIMTAVVFGIGSIAIAVPLAALIGFARIRSPPRLEPSKEFAAFLGLFMSAITEELLFRGLIQNMLEQRLGQESVVALLIASGAFALAHLRKAKVGFEAPNFRYAATAFVSGIACGLAWRYTGKVTTSALTHAVGGYTMWRVALSKKNDA